MCDPITVARVGLDRDEPVAAGGRALRTWAAVRPGRNIGARSPTATRRRDGRRSNCAEWRHLDEGAGDSAIPPCEERHGTASPDPGITSGDRARARDLRRADGPG